MLTWNGFPASVDYGREPRLSLPRPRRSLAGNLPPLTAPLGNSDVAVQPELERLLKPAFTGIQPSRPRKEASATQAVPRQKTGT